MQRLWNALTTMVCLWTALARKVDAGQRMVRRYAGCLTDTNTTLHRLTASSASGAVSLSAEAMEERLRGTGAGRAHHGGDQGRLRPLL